MGLCCYVLLSFFNLNSSQTDYVKTFLFEQGKLQCTPFDKIEMHEVIPGQKEYQTAKCSFSFISLVLNIFN